MEDFEVVAAPDTDYPFITLKNGTILQEPIPEPVAEPEPIDAGAD